MEALIWCFGCSSARVKGSDAQLEQLEQLERDKAGFEALLKTLRKP